MSLKLNLIAIAAGAAVFAGVTASAATLGGVRTNDLGANSNVVAAHVTGGIAVSFTTSYDTTAGYYLVTGVTLTPIGAADKFGSGAAVKLTLKGSAGASLLEVTGTTVAAQNTAQAPFSITVPTTPTPVAAADVQGVSIVINGGAVTAVNTALD